jgi:hypothetical protein
MGRVAVVAAENHIMTILIAVHDPRWKLATLFKDNPQSFDMFLIVSSKLKPHLVQDATRPVDIDVVERDLSEFEGFPQLFKGRSIEVTGLQSWIWKCGVRCHRSSFLMSHGQ